MQTMLIHVITITPYNFYFDYAKMHIDWLSIHCQIASSYIASNGTAI